jgi:hypothetical protein
MTRPAGPVDPGRFRIARENRARWRGHSVAGLERLRQAALRNRPWRFSTGPRTPEGKVICAANGRRLKRDIYSFPEIRGEIKQANALALALAELRERALSRR